MTRRAILFLLLLLPGAAGLPAESSEAGAIADRIAACGNEYQQQVRIYVSCHEKLKAIQAGTNKDLGKEGQPDFDAIAPKYYNASAAILKAEKDALAAAKSCSAITSEEDLKQFVQRVKQGRNRPLGCYLVKGLGYIRQPGAVPALLECLDKKYPWRCRVSALNALARRGVGKPEVIGRVQSCMSDGDTRIVRAAYDAFAYVTGEKKAAPAAKAGGKKGGKKGGKAGGQAEAKGDAKGAPVSSGGGHATFYKLEIKARSVIFVVDSSNSMKQTPGASNNKGKNNKKKKGGGGGASKFEVMKRELKKAIGGLPDGALVNIVDFNALIYVMSPRMMELSPATRPKVDAYIDNMKMWFATDISEALSTAMMIAHGILTGEVLTGGDCKAVDAFFFLTDGRPYIPKRFREKYGVSKTGQILSNLRFWNTDLRIPIHVIGIGAGDAEFLKKLAKEHDGEYATP
jgi:hypothetical protein